MNNIIKPRLQISCHLSSLIPMDQVLGPSRVILLFTLFLSSIRAHASLLEIDLSLIQFTSLWERRRRLCILVHPVGTYCTMHTNDVQGTKANFYPGSCFFSGRDTTATYLADRYVSITSSTPKSAPSMLAQRNNTVKSLAEHSAVHRLNLLCQLNAK